MSSDILVIGAFDSWWSRRYRRLCGPTCKTCRTDCHYNRFFSGGAHQSHDIVAQNDLAKLGDEMLVLVEQKKISPMLEEVISLEEIPQALLRLYARHVKGKIVAKLK